MNNLTFAYEQRPCLENLSFTLSPGKAWICQGENGSGKSTLVRLLAGLLPTSAVKRHHASLYLPAHGSLHPLLTAAENLQALLLLQKKRLHPYLIHQALTWFAVPNQVTYSLSSGQQQRLRLCRLLLETAPIWLLDEPLSFLDTSSQHQLGQLIDHHLHQGGSVFLTTHQPITISSQCAYLTLAA